MTKHFDIKIVELSVDEFTDRTSNLSAESKKKLIEAAGPIFTDKLYGIAMQNAIIVFLENYDVIGKKLPADHFFRLV